MSQENAAVVRQQFRALERDLDASVIEIGFSEAERFLDAEAGPPEDHDQATQASAVRMTATISSTLGGSAG